MRNFKKLFHPSKFLAKMALLYASHTQEPAVQTQQVLSRSRAHLHQATVFLCENCGSYKCHSKWDHRTKLDTSSLPSRAVVPHRAHITKRYTAGKMNNLLLRTLSKNFASRWPQHQIWKLEHCKGFIGKCAKRGGPNLGPATRRAITSGGNVNGRYEEVYKRSIEQPEEFWDEVAQDITWFKPYEKVLDDSNSPFTKW